MADIPVSEEQKAFFVITNDRIVHTPDYLLAQNASLKNRVASLQVLCIFHNYSIILRLGFCF